MSPKSSFFLALVAAAIALPAYAANDCSAQFKAEGKLIANSLMRKGYRQFGTLTMARLLQQMESVNVVPGQDLLGRKDLRSTARWSNNGGQLTVAVDCAWYNKFPRTSRSILAFHEYLWSLGVYDEIYWVSMGGWLLTQPLTHEALNKEEIGKLETWMGKIVVASKGGGVIGVGGGGEIETVECKARPIINALTQMKAVKDNPELRERWLEVFEDNLTKDQNCISGHRLNKL